MFQQERQYTCGVACVREVLKRLGRHVPSERALISELKCTPSQGTLPSAIERFFADAGLNVRLRQNGRVSDLARERTGYRRQVIVDWIDRGGHYCLIDRVQLKVAKTNNGGSYAGGIIVLADPASSDEGEPSGVLITSVARFRSMWWDPMPPTTKGLYISVWK